MAININRFLRILFKETSNKLTKVNTRKSTLTHSVIVKRQKLTDAVASADLFSPEATEMQKECIWKATEAIQATERLIIKLKQFITKGGDVDPNLKEQTYLVLGQLRDIKSKVEVSSEDFIPLDVNHNPLPELKQLLLMHVPSSINKDVCQKFERLIKEALDGHCKKILAAIVLTCPWYEATQKERGEQAKHNILLVIVMSNDRHFFTPANPQVQEDGSVLDLGWLSVIEMAHFGRFLAKFRARYVEALFCSKQALVFNSDEWCQLQCMLKAEIVTGTRPFLEAGGQALGRLLMKRINGENSTLAEICEAFRLLHHSHNHHNNLLPATETLQVTSLPKVAEQAWHKLQALSEDPDDIFTCLKTWHDELREKLKNYQYIDQKEAVSAIGQWMMSTRLQGRSIIPTSVSQDSHSYPQQLMKEMGGKVAKIEPENILLVARAGSHMYGLSTPDSDVDYIVVYKENTEKILQACRRPVECVEKRGPTKIVEYGAYEARVFSEMLLKGSVIILELVFLDNHLYVSPLWQILSQNKDKFVTELAIRQHLGFIKNNFAMLSSSRITGSGRERKILYQIFHKMDNLKYLMSGTPPPIRCSGETKDYIMAIRTGKLEGEFSVEYLLNKATVQFEEIKHSLANRLHRLPENPDFHFMTEWLLQVRGIQEQNLTPVLH